MKIRNPFKKRKETKQIKQETEKLESANQLALATSLASQLLKTLSRPKLKQSKQIGAPHPTRHKKRRKLAKMGKQSRKINYKKARS